MCAAAADCLALPDPITSMTIARKHIERAINEARDPWAVSNGVLYALCRKHPGHGDLEASTAMALKRSSIDTRLKPLRDELRPTAENAGLALAVHADLTSLLQKLTGLEKRSLASKYLHFHVPQVFFLFDGRAERASLSRRQLDRVLLALDAGA